MPKKICFKSGLFLLGLMLAGCGGDSGGGVSEGGPGCLGNCTQATPNAFLSTAEVERVIAQAANEALAQGAAATIAVVDRVGNVLGVFRMTGAEEFVTITSGRFPPVSGGLEGLAVIPDTLAAIAKAVTGAYLSSEGNAFSTRTASQIVQEHFNPGEIGQPSGPLFGVQFSQLPCSDLNTRFADDGTRGPKRSPLGLSADPGGLPLYKNGVPVGGVGVIADGIYGLDLNVTDRDINLDELIALAGTTGFAPPDDRRAERITVEGKQLRFSDADTDDLRAEPALAPGFNELPGELVAVPGYTDGFLVTGVTFGETESGIAPADEISPGLFDGLDAFVLVDENGANRFPPRTGNLLTDTEVTTILGNALAIANRSRAQIRRPAGSQARVTVAVVDTDGQILGIARTRDAPMFGIDVALQKARTAAFFSNAAAADTLAQAPDALYLNSDASAVTQTINIFDSYVGALRTFLGDPNALANGAVAFSDRAGGNLSRPFFPDGVENTLPGPFSKPFAFWSPFTDGLQLDLVINQVVNHVVFVLSGGESPDVEKICTNTMTGGELDRISNGIQIFPGSVPIYQGSTLAGGIGVSGDGVDQDDLVAFLGLHNAGLVLGTVNNAPPAIRADRLNIPSTDVSLRYVQCPVAPFLDSDEQNVCDGK